jgi:hypothetical protein
MSARQAKDRVGIDARPLLTLPVVTPSTGGVDQPSGDPRDQETVRDLEFQSLVELLLVVGQHGVELLSLYDSSRESIEDEPIRNSETRGWSRMKCPGMCAIGRLTRSDKPGCSSTDP